MKVCKISVIIPVYNGEAYIHNCVEKLLEQTFEDFEIIIIDDGSDDGTLELCEQMSSMHSRIKVYHQENAGPSQARNKGLEVANGAWIMFVDVDDWIEQDCLETAYRTAISEECDILFWNLQNEIESRVYPQIPLQGERRKFEGEQVKDLIRILLTGKTETGDNFLCMSGPCCKLIKRETIGKIRFPIHIDSGEDTCFVFQILDRAEKVIYISDMFYHRRIRSDSLSNKVDLNYGKRQVKYINWVVNYFADYDRDVINYFCYRRYRDVVQYFFQKLDKFSYKEIKNQLEILKNSLEWEIDYKQIPYEKGLICLKYDCCCMLAIYEYVRMKIHVLFRFLKKY